jgi:transcriptional regulator GlxA family with amidase domain
MARVAFLAISGALGSSIALPLEMFAAAEQRRRARRGPGGASLRLLGATAPATDMFGGLALLTPVVADDATDVDLLFLPSLWRRPGRALARNEKTLSLLARLVTGGTTVCAVGTGSYLLAACGLLDGQPATTHWQYLDDFARRFPAVRLQRHHLITQADRLYCAGSVNSVADLVVHFIEAYYDGDTARHVESQFSPEIRRPFDSYGFRANRATAVHDELVAEAQQRLLERIAEPPRLAQLAAQLGVTPRTLQRRFERALDISPRAFLQRARLELARELLRHSNLGIGDVAARCGFASGSRFAGQFRRHHGLTPQAYRRQVRGKLFATADIGGA